MACGAIEAGYTRPVYKSNQTQFKGASFRSILEACKRTHTHKIIVIFYVDVKQVIMEWSLT